MVGDSLHALHDEIPSLLRPREALMKGAMNHTQPKPIECRVCEHPGMHQLHLTGMAQRIFISAQAIGRDAECRLADTQQRRMDTHRCLAARNHFQCFIRCIDHAAWAMPSLSCILGDVLCIK